MKLKTKFKFLILVITALFLSFNQCIIIHAMDNDTLRNGLLETARAYYRKGSKIQYDSYRKNYNSTPEDATSQNTIYTVCSGFTYTTYKQTLGIEIPSMTYYLMDYAKKLSKNNNTTNLIYYNGDKDDVNTLMSQISEGTSQFMTDLANDVLPGDLVVVRYTRLQTDGGHVMMVESVDPSGTIKLLHSSGAAYNFNAYAEHYESNGTIQELSDLKEYLIDKLYKSSDTDIQSIAVLRFVTEDLTYPNPDNVSETLKINSLTDSANTRLKYPGLEIEKIATTANGNSNVVNLNDEITYKISIKNNSSTTYQNLKVIEKLNDSVEYRGQVLNGNIVYNSGDFSWTIQQLGANQTATITYTVRVKNDLNLLGKTIYSKGSVDSIVNRTIAHRIGNVLTKEEQKKLKDAYNSLKDNNKDSEIQFIIDVYKEAGLIDYAELLEKLYVTESSKYKNASDLVKVSTEKCSKINTGNNVYCKYIIDSSAVDILLNNYYGIRISKNNTVNEYVENLINPSYAWSWDNDSGIIGESRARTIMLDDLVVGDVILVYNETSNVLINKAYIYLGDGVLARKFRESLYKEYGLDGSVQNDGAKDSITSTSILSNIIGDNYIILRPSLGIKNNVVDTNTSNTSNVEVPDTGKNFPIYFYAIGMILVGIGICIIIYLFKNNFTSKKEQ